MIPAVSPADSDSLRGDSIRQNSLKKEPRMRAISPPRGSPRTAPLLPPPVPDQKSIDELRFFTQRLPIHEYRSRILRAISRSDFLIVVAETGSGKTTQVPQYLLEGGKEWGWVQPSGPVPSGPPVLGDLEGQQGDVGQTGIPRMATLTSSRRIAGEKIEVLPGPLEPGSHKQVIASMFGQTELEEPRGS